MSSDQYSNHYHSVSDGAVSYIESPSGNFQPPRWAVPVRRFDLGEFSTPSGGSKPEVSLLSQSTEKCFAAGVSSVSNSIGSASPPSESGQWVSTSRQPMPFPPRNISGRRSFMSKPVYPLSFRNPISDTEAGGLTETSGGRLTTINNNKSSLQWPDSDSSPELKFHKTLNELQKMESSLGPSTSSRREGFRWSNASSYDFGFEGDGIDASEHINLENLRSPVSTENQKCGLCRRLLCQKSPWSSYRIIRNGDMPVAGVLPCSHVFHAECLEETTPKTQIHEPPCPLCSRGPAIDESVSFSEPLQVALMSLRKNVITSTFNGVKMASNCSPNQNDGDLKRNRSLPMLRLGGRSLFKSHLKKHFPFKGKTVNDLSGAKVFGNNGCSSSSSMLHVSKKKSGFLRTGLGQSSK